MNEKMTITDFLDILYTAVLQQPFITITISDIYTILRIIGEVSEFEDIKNLIRPCTIEETELFRGQRITGKMLTPTVEPEKQKQIIETYPELIERCNDLIRANHLIDIVHEQTNRIAGIELDTPDGIYYLGHSDTGYESKETVIYTDGDVIPTHERKEKVDSDFTTVRNIEISNATYSIFKMLKNGEIAFISARSKYLSSNHILGEINSVIKETTEHYKLLDSEHPRVYILRRQ